MCFVNNNDYEWITGHSEETSGPATAPAKCVECRKVIAIGERCHHLYQQEAEEGECVGCCNGECDGEAGCPDLGETFECYWCDNCYRFLEAVAKAEEAAGCAAYESRPPIGEMKGAIVEGGVEEAEKYFVQAESDYPDLKASGWLDALWEKLFEKTHAQVGTTTPEETPCDSQ